MAPEGPVIVVMHHLRTRDKWPQGQVSAVCQVVPCTQVAASGVWLRAPILKGRDGLWYFDLWTRPKLGYKREWMRRTYVNRHIRKVRALY